MFVTIPSRPRTYPVIGHRFVLAAAAAMLLPAVTGIPAGHMRAFFRAGFRAR